MDLSSLLTDQSPSTYTGSSHTGSSRSKTGTSITSNRDYTLDNSLSPIDVECMIQAERITDLLDEMVDKTKLAVCVCYFVEENDTLTTVLSPEHLEKFMMIFERLRILMDSSTLLNAAILEDLNEDKLTLKERLCPDLGRIVYILTDYPLLKPKIEEIITKMKSEHKASRNLKNGESLINIGLDISIPPSTLDYLDTLEHYREQMLMQLNETAAEVLSAKFKARRLERSNAKLIDRISMLKKTLKDEHVKFEKTMKKKTKLLEELTQELAMARSDADIFPKKTVIRSEIKMVMATRQHILKNELLCEMDVESQRNFKTLLHCDIENEKKLRARRFKVETQLLSWLQKYDIDIGEKQSELDELQKLYDVEAAKCEELKEKLAIQDLEYIPIYEEREAEYQAELTEKMNSFLLEHSARVLQVAWREVLKNRAERRQLKKIQKKMQAAAEAFRPIRKR